MEVGKTPIFAFSRMMPAPFFDAINTMSVANGWSFEAAHQGFMCMVSWMEHNETRLREFATERYARPCNVPCFAGLDASDRKSSLKTWLTVDLLNVEGMPENIKLGKCVCTDGTLKGWRNSIEVHNRTGIVSDEVSNTYETSFSEKQNGIHYAGRSKMATFTSCERDQGLTGGGHTDLPDYTFLHYVIGQVEATEEVLRPTPGGFQKRFHILFPKAARSFEPDLCTTGSESLLKATSSWMAKHATVQKCDFHLSEAAKSMHRAAQAAIEDFLANATDICPFLRMKLKYADTDLLRYTNVAKRMVLWSDKANSKFFCHLPAHVYITICGGGEHKSSFCKQYGSKRRTGCPHRPLALSQKMNREQR